MGTPAFSVPTLQALLDSHHSVIAVYTQPPRPSGRGHHVQKSPIHLLAEKHNIPVYTPKTLRSPESQEEFSALRADAAVVIAYGLILPKAILDAPQFGCINVHASLLPRWRGAAPIHRALLAGDAETGITIMKMDEGLDTGPMLSKGDLPIGPTTSATDLHDQLSKLGADLLLPALEGYIAGNLTPLIQPEEGVTYAHKLAREEGRLEWQNSADYLERQIRALNPWPGTWFEHEGVNLKVSSATVVEDDSTSSPGLVLDDHLIIACGQGTLHIHKIQRPGGAPLTTEAFLRGYALPKGTLLPSPKSHA